MNYSNPILTVVSDYIGVGAYPADVLMSTLQELEWEGDSALRYQGCACGEVIAVLSSPYHGILAVETGHELHRPW